MLEQVDEEAHEGDQSPFHGIPDSGDAKNVGLNKGTAITDPALNIKQPRDLKQLRVFSGYSSFDMEMKAKKAEWNWDKRSRAATTVMLMSIFAIMGTILRIFIAQLFGEECKNPGTVGWLKASQPLCVTAEGEATFEGGIIFADFPANILGCFIMGMMQTTDILGYPKQYPVPWLSKDHIFQSWDIWHLAIRTGFCGSLTTFSAWNSEMVIMLFGTGSSNNSSRALRALFGYSIGLETAVGSFNLGKNVASALFAWFNPDMRVEKESIKEKKARGIYINMSLPDFERRFLAELNMYEYEEYLDPTIIQSLLEWRVSTEQNRRFGDPLLPLLTDVEHETLVLKNELDGETRRAADNAGWDLRALDCWVNETNVRLIDGPKSPPETTNIFPIFFTFMMLYILLITGLIYVDANDAYSITWRTMWYASLFAPLGAIVRWQWSSYNGKLSGSFSWFPMGTYLANVVGCIVSIVMIGLEFRYAKVGDVSGFWLSGTLRAIKIGFSGCLTTVSTFVSEITVFLSGPRPFHRHIYVLITLGTTFLLSLAAYALCVMGLLDVDEES